MSAVEKAEALAKVASSGLPKREVLSELGVPRSTYYRWLRRREQRGLEDDAGGGEPPWNRLTFREVDHVLSAAREMPELSPRQLASWVTDNMGFSVSESTVYHILRREGLVKRPEMRLAAGKEYHRKTTGPHQMWSPDASYFRVVGWGYYYLVTVMDDYSRFILAHRLQRDMTSDSFIEVVQEAVDRTGMDQVPITDRTRLLSDNADGVTVSDPASNPGLVSDCDTVLAARDTLAGSGSLNWSADTPIAQCVAGALISDGKVLLVKRSPQAQHYPGVWDLFGGHIEGEESPEDALCREALEELQVEIKSFHSLGTVHDAVEPAEIEVFAVSTWEGVPVNAAPDEHSQIGWFPAKGLPDSVGLDAYRELVVQALAMSAQVD